VKVPGPFLKAARAKSRCGNRYRYTAATFFGFADHISTSYAIGIIARFWMFERLQATFI
jgi:hypothetical protein